MFQGIHHSSPRNLLPWYHDSPMISTLHNHEKCKMTALVEKYDYGRKSNTPTNSICDLIVPQLFGSNLWFRGHKEEFTHPKKAHKTRRLAQGSVFPPKNPNIAQGTKAAPSSLSVSYLEFLSIGENASPVVTGCWLVNHQDDGIILKGSKPSFDVGGKGVEYPRI